MKSSPIPQGKPVSKPKKKSSVPSWLSRLAWGVAILMVVLMMYLLWQRSPVAQAARASNNAEADPVDIQPDSQAIPEKLPALQPTSAVEAIVRVTNQYTIHPGRSEPEKYTSKRGIDFCYFKQFKSNRIEPLVIIRN